MGRNRAETCMFCSESPCVCNKPVPKPRVSREPKTTTSTVVKKKLEVVDLPILDKPKRAPLRPTISKQQQDDNDQEYRRALTLLCESGLVCADDIEKNKTDLN